MISSEKKTIGLELRNFEPLKVVEPRTKKVHSSLEFELNTLAHHYFFVKYGEPTHPDCFEYASYLTQDDDWRFKENGIGGDTESKRNVSNELAKAFARWFHCTYLDFCYFAPFNLTKMNKGLTDGSEWIRTERGDLPDYVCGKSPGDFNLLEVKGRYEAVGFDTKQFGEFRKQVCRADLLDRAKNSVAVNRFVSVARWATETKKKGKSKLLVEQVASTPSPNGDIPSGQGDAMVFGHYGSVLKCLQLPVLAEAIARGLPPPRTTGQRGIWKCIVGPAAGRTFVGGLLRDHRLERRWSWPFFYDAFDLPSWWQATREESAFVLSPPQQFFGLERNVMRRVLGAARQGGFERGASDGLGTLDMPAENAEVPALSFLRDGTIFGLADYFEPVGIEEF